MKSCCRFHICHIKGIFSGRSHLLDGFKGQSYRSGTQMKMSECSHLRTNTPSWFQRYWLSEDNAGYRIYGCNREKVDRCTSGQYRFVLNPLDYLIIWLRWMLIYLHFCFYVWWCYLAHISHQSLWFLYPDSNFHQVSQSRCFLFSFCLHILRHTLIQFIWATS